MAEGNNRNVVVVVVEGKQWKCGGGGIIVSLFTKLC